MLGSRLSRCQLTAGLASVRRTDGRESSLLGMTRHQEGMASIVAVSVLVVLMTLISLGFARLMSRTTQNAANRQFSSAAIYAGQSAINDVSAYIKDHPTAHSDQCSGNDTLIGSAANPGPFYNDSNLSGDNGTKYSCLLLNQTPTDLFFQTITSLKSRVVKMTTSAYPGSLEKAMISWQPSNGLTTGYPLSSSNLNDIPTWNSATGNICKDGGGNFKSCIPMLRLTIYPIPTGGDLTNVVANSKTVFLYPQNGSGAASAVPSQSYTAITDGSILPVNCGQLATGGGVFTGSTNFVCNIILTNLTSAVPPPGITDYLVLKITPIYSQADVRLQTNDLWGTQLKFVNGQAVVDVTTASGGTTKRLQARVNIGGASSADNGGNISSADDAIPEGPIRSANTICKRLAIGAASLSIDAQNCYFALTGLPTYSPYSPPTVTTGPPTNVSWDQMTANGTVNPNGSSTTWCFQGNNTGASFAPPSVCTRTLSGNPADNTVHNVSFDWFGLSSWPPGNRTGYYRICASNAGGDACGAVVSCTLPNEGGTGCGIGPPPPPGVPVVTLNANPLSVPAGGGSVTLTWNSTNNPLSCNASGAGDWSGGKDPSPGNHNQGVSLTSSTTYTITCTNGSGTSAPASVTVIVGSSPPPAPTCNISSSSWNPPDTGVSGQHHSATFNVSSTNALNATGSLSYYDGSSGGSSIPLPINGSAPIGDFYYNGGADHRSGHLVMTVTGSGGSGSCAFDTPWLMPPAPTISLTLVKQYYGPRNPLGAPFCDDGYHAYMFCGVWTATRSDGGPVACFVFSHDAPWGADIGSYVYQPSASGGNIMFGWPYEPLGLPPFYASPYHVVWLWCNGDGDYPGLVAQAYWST